MRTYATRICSGRAHGFTLIEVLVVVIVVGVLMSVVAAGFTGADREQALRGYTERLALRIELARDKAVQTNREWGMYVENDGIRFAEFDPVNAEWLPRGDRPFGQEGFARDLSFAVEVEAFAGLPDTEDTEDQPDVLLFSSGETTPFSIQLEPRDWITAPWLLSSDGFTRTIAVRDEDAS